MDSVKEEKLTKNIRIISAVLLVIILAGISYFLISNQQMKKIVQIQISPPEEPIGSRKTNSVENELLYAAAELSRSIDYGDPITLGEQLEGSPGVYRVNVYEQEREGVYTVDAFGNLQQTGIESVSEEVGVIIKK